MRISRQTLPFFLSYVHFPALICTQKTTLWPFINSPLKVSYLHQILRTGRYTWLFSATEAGPLKQIPKEKEHCAGRLQGIWRRQKTRLDAKKEYVLTLFSYYSKENLQQSKMEFWNKYKFLCIKAGTKI